MSYDEPIYAYRNLGCSKATEAWATFGQIVVAVLAYVLLLFLIKELYLTIKGKKWAELDDDNKTYCVLYCIFWGITVPVTIVIFFLYWLAKGILLPFTAVEKSDLRATETRINRKIDAITPKVKETTTPNTLTKGFKEGDLVTGIRGNPDNYKHLTEGSVSRVKSIDEQGIMTLVLVDHKDYANHKEKVGETFTAPVRNFVRFTRVNAKKR